MSRRPRTKSEEAPTYDLTPLRLLSPAPCTPATISPVVDCEANNLTVSWSESSGADSYIATVQDSNGQATNCQGMSEGWCSITGLGCGQIYHVSVVSSDGYCSSPPTDVVNTPSGWSSHMMITITAPHCTSHCKMSI